MITRRNFIKTSALTGAAGITGILSRNVAADRIQPNRITIHRIDSDFEREPLAQPFGFKGGYISELWQAIVYLQSASGIGKVGLGTQSVLWSDASVFASHTESGGNALMYAMTEYALQELKGIQFSNPIELLDAIFDDVYQYGKKITNNPDLRKTFALNSLVAVDNAAWLLYAAENGLDNFDDLVPGKYRTALSHNHNTVASIPLLSYNVPVAEIKQAVADGYFFLKIKIGQAGTQEEMLAKDMRRLSEIHEAIGRRETPHTEDGRPCYYLDANGRYQQMDTFLRLLDHIEKIGAMDQVAIIEEPFPEELRADVSGIPVRLAADESAHTVEDALERIQMGYRAIALKAIAKTLSMTLKIAGKAAEHQVPCFCADLTVNPILVDWNKNVAARLAPFPGLRCGLLETNGHQNYRNWKRMEQNHPCPDASWRQCREGIFHLDQDFYLKSGGILQDSRHYMALFNKNR